MRKIIATIFTMLCLLAFIGCQQRKPDKLELFDVGMENTSLDSYQTEGVFCTEEKPKVSVPESTEATGGTIATLDPMTETTVGTEATEETQPSRTSKDETPTKPKADEAKPTPTQPLPAPTVPKVTQPETEPTVPTTVPPETEPANPEPTQPETKPTVPETKPTEPAGCTHDWQAIHHEEKGRWKAGVVCDCGWVVYGNADELVSKWNAHSASYPAEVALFEHGGYGSADKWIVDEPAYDEWVCRLCREPKP